MNVQVKHNGTDISSKIISYEREHKICTGIGTLEVVISKDISATFVPWDEIDIHENGSFQVRYYVSDVSISVPDGTITLSCQDKSKRLADYFIPTQYTIDYPSYTGYWIKKFLTEAGVSYRFLVSDVGVLLSNNTSLGLQLAYEQITLLLQLSGWYMYFDGNGKAVIGSLTTDLSDSKETFTENDLLSVTKTSDDKMLRNRAVVWGAYDVLRNQNSFADVKVHTRWNYDNRDYRTMVVSNSNIPNKSSAYSIANKLLKEFSKITIEKHLIVAGCSNRNLGEVVRVRSRAFKGSGLITTFGVSMSSRGLVTNIILDERCPRLFGFFDFGDYVYVGTYGGGIWRKHVKYDHTWYDFSTGLTNLEITDLHINNDVFGSIGSNGEMFYAESSDGPWVAHPVDGLMSSADDLVEGSGVTLVPFYGLKGRATIIDKVTNTVKFGVDNASGINKGDYFLDHFTASSGVVASGISTSGYRSWIVEFDPFASEQLSYPVNFSGNYNFTVVDLENDGINDYISVRTTGASLTYTSYGYDFGRKTSQNFGGTQPNNKTQDSSAKASFAPLENYDVDNIIATLSTVAFSCVTVFNNESIQESEVLWIRGNAIWRYKIARDPVYHTLGSTTLTSPATVSNSSKAIIKLSTNTYRYFYDIDTATQAVIAYKDWDANTNTLSGEVVVSTLTYPSDSYHGTNQRLVPASTIIVNDTIYRCGILEVYSTTPVVSDPDFANKANNYIKVFYQVVYSSGTEIHGVTAPYSFNTGDQSAVSGQAWTIHTNLTINSLNFFRAFQKGDNPLISIFIQEDSRPFGLGAYEAISYLLYSLDGFNFNIQQIQQTTNSSDPDFIFNTTNTGLSQLTGEQILYYVRDGINNATLIYNGESTTFTHFTSIPFQMNPSNIFPQFGTFDNYYIATTGGTWYFCNPQTLSIESILDTGIYTLYMPFDLTGTISESFYWYGLNTLTGKTCIVESTTAAITHVCTPVGSIGFSTTAKRKFNIGNFFIDETFPTLQSLYLNNYKDVPNTVYKYMVLQRDNSNFNLIQQAGFPIRVDISNNSPLETVTSGENSFKSHYISETELTTVFVTGSFIFPKAVKDFRYTILENPVVVDDGSDIQPAEKVLLYAADDGIRFSYVDTLVSGFSVLYEVPSGISNRLETSNYVSSGQYVFVTISGDNTQFYQKEPSNSTFDSHPGLPDFRGTIIRLDDRF